MTELQPTYLLRPMQRSDAQALLDGRNSELVHPFLFSNHKITGEEHERWVQKKLASADMQVFVFLHKNTPIGMVNLTHLDSEHGRGEWGFHIWAADAPKGAGTCMLAAFLDETFLRRGLRKLCALVLCTNARSLHLHRKLGFSEEGLFKEHVMKNNISQDVAAFALFDRDWRSKREHFVSSLAQVHTGGVAP